VLPSREIYAPGRDIRLQEVEAEARADIIVDTTGVPVIVWHLSR
jgi:hypothetical protein